MELSCVLWYHMLSEVSNMDTIRQWISNIWQSLIDNLLLGVTVYYEGPSEIPDITNE